MLVLGIGGFYHDYNCALIDVENKQVAMIEAERISRRKHHVIRPGEDLLAPIERCCNDLGVSIKNIDTVVFGHTDPFPVKEKLQTSLGRRKKYVSVDHHLAHAAAAFFSSQFEDASIVSLDGYGDGSSALLAAGQGNKIEELTRTDDQNSFGLEYLRATIHLGLGGHGEEGKTQGLAAYGEPTYYEAYMEQIDVDGDGRIHLGPALQGDITHLSREGGYLNTELLTNSFLNDLFPRRISPEPLDTIHKNLAASVQKVLDEIGTKLGLIVKQKTGKTNLVLGGGVSMNSTMNGVLLLGSQFAGLYALPMASDRGIGLGAALYHIHQELNVPRFFYLDQVFYGGAYKDKDAERAMKEAGLRTHKSDDVKHEVAQALNNELIVGWFQGRSEMGARALGHRSILANPGRAEMKNIINERVKHREWFRPFAPSVMEEFAEDYFAFPANVADLTFMTFTVPATPRGEREIPATVHVDKTSRVQLVSETTNPEYHAVINAFRDLSGLPVVLNTSFNDKGEPIVETPENAVRTFLNTDMDMLCIGNMIGLKK
ncbi:MAG: carbamoyltransferase C-terminal domain-containing protein [Anaerolineales bacterium]